MGVIGWPLFGVVYYTIITVFTINYTIGLLESICWKFFYTPHVFFASCLIVRLKTTKIRVLFFFFFFLQNSQFELNSQYTVHGYTLLSLLCTLNADFTSFLIPGVTRFSVTRFILITIAQKFNPSFLLHNIWGTRKLSEEEGTRVRGTMLIASFISYSSALQIR